MRVGDFDAVALKEALVYGVDEGLLVAEIEVFSGVFNGLVEVAQAAHEIGAVEIGAGERVDDLFDFGGDDISAGEVLDIKDAADDALGHQVLDQHFVDGFDADVGVERAAAKLHEFVELALETGVVSVGGVDLGFELPGDFANLLAVRLDRFVEILAGLFFVIEILAQQRGEVLLFADSSAARFIAILIEDSGDGVFEDDVVQRIADRFLVFDFGEEIVAAVFGFPEGERSLPFIDQRAVGADMAPALPLCGVFVNQRQLAAAAESGEERSEGAAEIAFGRLGLGSAQFLDGIVVLLEVAVVGLDGDGRHRACFRRVKAARYSTPNPENFLLVTPASIVIYLTIEKSCLLRASKT